MSKQMTIAEIKALPDGSWVSAEVVGDISSAKNMDTKTGKKMGVAKLGDSTDTIDLTSFDKQFTGVNGKRVEFTGPGMKKDSYNGYAKLMIGGKTMMNVIEGGGDLPEAPVKNPSGPAPAPVAGGEAFEEAFFRRVKTGMQMAIDLEIEFDGHVVLKSEDKRAIAISYQIAAERAGK